MTITVLSTSTKHKADIIDSRNRSTGYTATSTIDALTAAKACITKWFGEASADTIYEIRDAAELTRRGIKSWTADPKRKQTPTFYGFTNKK